MLPVSAGDWEWENDLRQGTLTITVPAGVNGTGDVLSIMNIMDSSGNASTEVESITLF